MKIPSHLVQDCSNELINSMRLLIPTTLTEISIFKIFPVLLPFDQYTYGILNRYSGTGINLHYSQCINTLTLFQIQVLIATIQSFHNT